MKACKSIAARHDRGLFHRFLSSSSQTGWFNWSDLFGRALASQRPRDQAAHRSPRSAIAGSMKDRARSGPDRSALDLGSVGRCPVMTKWVDLTGSCRSRRSIGLFTSR